jgi:hypothetical protein
MGAWSGCVDDGGGESPFVQISAAERTGQSVTARGDLIAYVDGVQASTDATREGMAVRVVTQDGVEVMNLPQRDLIASVTLTADAVITMEASFGDTAYQAVRHGFDGSVVALDGGTAGDLAGDLVAVQPLSSGDVVALYQRSVRLFGAGPDEPTTRFFFTLITMDGGGRVTRVTPMRGDGNFDGTLFLVDFFARTLGFHIEADGAHALFGWRPRTERCDVADVYRVNLSNGDAERIMSTADLTSPTDGTLSARRLVVSMDQPVIQGDVINSCAQTVTSRGTPAFFALGEAVHGYTLSEVEDVVGDGPGHIFANRFDVLRFDGQGVGLLGVEPPASVNGLVATDDAIIITTDAGVAVARRDGLTRE